MLSVTADLLMSAGAITSPAMDEQVMQRDLYELNNSGALLLLSSTSRIMYCDCDKRSVLLARDASESSTACKVVR